MVANSAAHPSRNHQLLVMLLVQQTASPVAGRVLNAANSFNVSPVRNHPVCRPWSLKPRSGA